MSVADTQTLEPTSSVDAEIFDVLIIGAGIAGIGAAYHMKTQRPEKTYVVLEAQESFGGTWRTHVFPGVRSDSDLFTFGYRFKPWEGTPIASGAEILSYMEEVITENALGDHIRYGYRIETASWSDAEALWTLTIRRGQEERRLVIKGRFLWTCQGFYRHEGGYTPDWPGMAEFQGPIVHPQSWPQDLDYKDKSVLVIGSGATAATLIPAMANDAAHVTLLQRSPTYFIPGQNSNLLADTLREIEVDPLVIHDIVRRKVLLDQDRFVKAAFADPESAKAMLLAGVRAYLPQEAVDAHFTPKYMPWRQRVAFVPEGDFFKAVLAGKASVVTDEIDSFVADGVRLKSGEVLKADIIVTATGFNMTALGGIDFVVNGATMDVSKCVSYRGMMFTGLPNLVWVFGYFRASWTLRVDLVGDFVCRLLAHMDAQHKAVVEVAVPPEDQDMELLPWIDQKDFNPGYLQRVIHTLPRRGSKPQWAHTQDYWLEKRELPKVALDGPEFQYR